MIEGFGDVAAAFVAGDKTALEKIADDRGRYASIQRFPEWPEIQKALNDAYRAATEEAFNNPARIEYARGLRDGLMLFQHLIGDADSEVNAAHQAIRDLEDEELPIEPLGHSAI